MSFSHEKNSETPRKKLRVSEVSHVQYTDQSTRNQGILNASATVDTVLLNVVRDAEASNLSASISDKEEQLTESSSDPESDIEEREKSMVSVLSDSIHDQTCESESDGNIAASVLMRDNSPTDDKVLLDVIRNVNASNLSASTSDVKEQSKKSLSDSESDIEEREETSLVSIPSDMVPDQSSELTSQRNIRACVSVHMSNESPTVDKVLLDVTDVMRNADASNLSASTSDIKEQLKESLSDSESDIEEREEKSMVSILSDSLHNRTCELDSDGNIRACASVLMSDNSKNEEQFSVVNLDDYTHFSDDVHSSQTGSNFPPETPFNLSFLGPTYSQSSQGEIQHISDQSASSEAKEQDSNIILKSAEMEQDDEANERGTSILEHQTESSGISEHQMEIVSQEDMITVDVSHLMEQECVGGKVGAYDDENSYLEREKYEDTTNVTLDADHYKEMLDPDDEHSHVKRTTNNNFDDAKVALLQELFEGGTMAEIKSSTPMKQAPLSDTFSLLSPVRGNESDLSSITSAEASESEEEETTSGFLKENSDSEWPILAAPPDDASSFRLHQAEVSGTENSDAPHYTTILTEASLLNQVKLYDGSSLSVNEGILKIMNLDLKNQQSKSGLDRSLKTICSFLPEDHNLPTSSQSILKYIESLAPPVPSTCHFYCKSCLFYHGMDIVGHCQVCGVETEFGHFYSFDIGALVKFFFESRNLASIIESEESKDCDPTALRCLKDGTVYKSMNATRSKYDISLIFGSDGVRIRKGSTKELWLSQFTIAELPIHLQKSFLTVIGVWYDEKKPDMKTFLKPFAERMKALDQGYESGVEWTHPSTGVMHKSCVRLLVCVLDAPARAITQNVMQFNSRYGCNLCETKAQLTERVVGSKRVRVYHYAHNPKLRTKERMWKQALEVGERLHLKGVKGPSVLSIIPSVNISECMVPEYMHSVLIGVVKQQLIIWTQKPGPWSLKERITEMDAFLKTFKHPSFVHRSQRQLKSLKYWKASDFYYFLLFESLPTLHGHLKDKYLQHFILLVKGIYTLLKTSVTEEEISEADLLLRIYVNDFGKLYGDRELTYNIHQLLHLALCVRRFGPLHCYSAFMFEDMNGLIAKATHGTNHVHAEIVNNIKICQGVNILENVVRGCDGFCESSNAYSEGELLGKEVSNTLVAPEELNILQDVNAKIFSRAKLGYDVYTSEIHKKLSSENFHVMWTENGLSRFGSVIFFAETSQDKVCVLRMLNVDHTRVFHNEETVKCVDHIIPVKTAGIFVAKFSNIVPSMIKTGKIGSYVYKRPNLYRYVM